MADCNHPPPLGCRCPVLQGAVAKISSWQLAAAVPDAGGHGLIKASGK